MMKYGYGGPVGLGKPPTREFCLDYLSNPSNKSLHILFVPSNKCNNEAHLINFHDLFVFMYLIFVDSDNLENLLQLKVQ